MNLVEFPDDKIAFDPTKVTSIVGMSESKLNSETPTCDMECPGRFDAYGGHTLNFCDDSDHYDTTLVDYTMVTVAGKELRVNRTFHDVMLIITANLLDNNQTGELS